MADDVETLDTETPEADETQAELAKLRVALKEANKESASRRKRLEELEKQEAERKAAEMTESDRLKAEIAAARKEAEEARTQARDTLVRSLLISEAAKVGCADPDDICHLVDRSGIEVQEDGTVTGVAEAVKRLVDAKPYLLGGKTPPPKLDGGAGGRERADQSNRLSEEELRIAKAARMTPEQYAKRRAERVIEEE